MKLITNLALLFAVATAIATAQVSPTHPFPDDPEELNRVTCGQNADYDCIWCVGSAACDAAWCCLRWRADISFSRLVNHQIDLPVFVDPKMNYKTVTRANGESRAVRCDAMRCDDADARLTARSLPLYPVAGERIVVTGPGAKGSITARCLNNPALSSQLDFSFDLASGNQVNHVRGIMNVRSVWGGVPG